MNREEDSDLEIYGTSPGVIAFFMILISLIVPIGIIPSYAFILFGGVSEPLEMVVYGLIWVWFPSMNYQMLNIVLLYSFAAIWSILPLTLFNFLYVAQIIRYYRGKCPRYCAVWVGLLSITLPTVFAFVTTGILFSGSVFVLVGPIPLQFIAGLIIMHKIPGPEMTSPWRGDLDDHSWWKPKKPDWLKRIFRASQEDEVKESESKNEWLEAE